MVATPHVLAGGFASRFVRSPRRALAAGVISHLALDRIPHTDYQLANRKALVADLAVATLLGVSLARRDRLAAAGAFGGLLPDLITVAELRCGVRVILPLHHANHTSIEPPVVIGVLTQLITAGVLLTRLHRAGRTSQRAPRPRSAWGANLQSHREQQLAERARLMAAERLNATGVRLSSAPQG